MAKYVQRRPLPKPLVRLSARIRLVNRGLGRRTPLLPCWPKKLTRDGETEVVVRREGGVADALEQGHVRLKKVEGVAMPCGQREHESQAHADLELAAIANGGRKLLRGLQRLPAGVDRGFEGVPSGGDLGEALE
jgi:hypothetical protein